ncbi:hypothetical protein [Brevundimonas sp.]|uniref:hypothetical protein n=1 Tax=Brevundimonas sp. TaxID=1871086 RepID=UPI0028A5F814|nr:hypothetical protein [Brevundimonas sp.]
MQRRESVGHLHDLAGAERPSESRRPSADAAGHDVDTAGRRRERRAGLQSVSVQLLVRRFEAFLDLAEIGLGLVRRRLHRAFELLDVRAKIDGKSVVVSRHRRHPPT